MKYKGYAIKEKTKFYGIRESEMAQLSESDLNKAAFQTFAKVLFGEGNPERERLLQDALADGTAICFKSVSGIIEVGYRAPFLITINENLKERLNLTCGDLVHNLLDF